MKYITLFLFLFTITACSSTSDNSIVKKEKTLIGQDIIDDGGRYFGYHFSKDGYQYCQYMTDFGNETYLKKDFNEECAKK